MFTPDSLKIIIFIILAIGIMVGLTKKKSVFKYIISILFIPVLLMVAYNTIRDFLSTLEPVERFFVLLILVLLIVVSLLVFTKFGREVLASMIANFITGFIKLIGRLIKKVFGFKKIFIRK